MTWTGVTMTRRVLAGIRPVDVHNGRAISPGIITCRCLDAVLTQFTTTHTGVIALHEVAIPGNPSLNSSWRSYAAGGAAPAALPLTLELSSADGSYLTRHTTLALPRSLDAEAADAIATPVDVACFRQANRQPHPGFAALLVHVERISGAPFAGAWCQVVIDGSVVAHAVSDASGDALIEVPGLRAREPDANNGFVIPVTAATLRVIADRRGPWPVNPEALATTPAPHLSSQDSAIALRLDQLTRAGPITIPDAV